MNGVYCVRASRYRGNSAGLLRLAPRHLRPSSGTTTKRWDGSGYPGCLQGRGLPAAGVAPHAWALADAYYVPKSVVAGYQTATSHRKAVVRA